MPLSKDHEIICVDTSAFYAIIREVVNRLKEERGDQTEPEWISEEEAMRLLGISAKSTLQNFRNEGKLRFSKTTPKTILYFRKSVMDYINSKAKDAFQ